MIVFGLGNPGEDYARTRHNLGFMFLDKLIKKVKHVKEVRYKNSICFASQKDIFVYPLTFMNLSGLALEEIMKKHKFDISELLIVCDDISLPLGTIRIRKRGSAGGHNGLKSIIAALNTENFARMRLGIRNDYGEDVVDFVLSEFKDAEWPVVEQMLNNAVSAFFDIKTRGIDYAMNKYNRKGGQK